MTELLRCLVHPSDIHQFEGQIGVWDQWMADPDTHVIHGAAGLDECSYLEQVDPGGTVLVGGQAANDCIDRHLRTLADCLPTLSYPVSVKVSRPATWGMDAWGPNYTGIDQVVQRIFEDTGVHFPVTDEV